MLKQVNKKFYNFHKYSFPGRWVSYYYQINETLLLNPKTILEIGTGDGVYKNFIINNTSIDYKNMDIAEDLSPDMVGSVDDIPLTDDSFDLIAAFEILEHLPFSQFEKSLSEIRRVSKKYVIISLPHFGPPVKINFKLPFLKEVKVAFKIPFYKKHKFNGQHYWEIGKKDYSPGKIRKIIKKYFKIKKEFIPFENQYHHFFVLENK